MNKYLEAYGRIIDSSDLKIHVENGLPMNQDTKDVLLVQELVDRATPIKPNRVICKTQISKYSIMIEHKVYCPICNTKILIEGNCCPNNDCRQAIDWSQDE